MKKTFLVLAVLLLTSTAFAEILPGWEKGFIFNIPSILLEVEEYQGGLGVRLGKDKWAVRAIVDFYAEDDGTEPSVISFGAGGLFQWYLIPLQNKEAEERHWTTHPYVGGTIGINGSSEKTEIDGGDWTRDDVLAVEFGPVLGIEFFLLENVSVFAEYQITGMLGWPSVITNVDGDENTVQGDMIWSCDLSLGNSGMIGLCIFF